MLNLGNIIKKEKFYVSHVLEHHFLRTIISNGKEMVRVPGFEPE